MSNNWESWEKEIDKEYEATRLKDIKRGSIAYIKEIDELTTWKIYHAHWEDCLSSSPYFKNWRERIKSFQTEKEVNFYTSRLRAFMEFVEGNTRKEVNYVDEKSPKQWDPINTPKLIEQELKRLENISEEEFNKTDKWKNSVEFKELSIKEMKNDPWFSKQIFGSENEKNKEKENSDYKSWTKEQLIAEINRLKSENEQLKNNQILTSSNKQKKLKENQQRLERLESIIGVDNSNTQQPTNNSSLTPLLVFVSILALASLGIYGIVKKTKKIKK